MSVIPIIALLRTLLVSWNRNRGPHVDYATRSRVTPALKSKGTLARLLRCLVFSVIFRAIDLTLEHLEVLIALRDAPVPGTN